MSAIAKLNGINYSYSNGTEKTTVLRDINLQINAGEFVAIMGPSGSGKSTLANILGLLVSNFQGQFVFDQQTLSSQTSPDFLNQLRAKALSFIFQDYILLEHLNVLENVVLPLTYFNISSEDAAKKALELLNSLHIKDKYDRAPQTLSGGQRQRVAIARALVKNPLMIIADEPTGALDKKSRHDVLAILQSIALKGTAIVMVTHSEDDARAADRIIKIDDGRIVADDRQSNRKIFELQD